MSRAGRARYRRRSRATNPATTARLEQLKTLAALRGSGALTEAEFEAEKRRVLGDS